MGKDKTLSGGRLSRRRTPATIRPYTMRVKRDHGQGLWELEDDTGQLYLAVLAIPQNEFRRRRLEEARASGAAYRPPQGA